MPSEDESAPWPQVDWDVVQARNWAKVQQVRAQLAALRAGPGARRRRFRLHSAVCRHCGEVVLEVYATHPHWCIVTWGTVHSTEVEAAALHVLEENENPRMDWRDEAWRQARRLARRRGPEELFLLVETPKAPPSTAPDWFSVCRCRMHKGEGVALLEDLLSGVKRRTV